MKNWNIKLTKMKLKGNLIISWILLLFSFLQISFIIDNCLYRLLNILAASIGDPSNGSALAMHLKCLSCDKPLNPFGIGANGGSGGNGGGQGLTQLLSSNDDDDRLNWSTYPRNDNPVSPLSHRPNTTNTANNRMLSSKSTPQLRHSTEALPPVNNQLGMNSIQQVQHISNYSDYYYYYYYYYYYFNSTMN